MLPMTSETPSPLPTPARSTNVPIPNPWPLLCSVLANRQWIGRSAESNGSEIKVHGIGVDFPFPFSPRVSCQSLCGNWKPNIHGDLQWYNPLARVNTRVHVTFTTGIVRESPPLNDGQVSFIGSIIIAIRPHKGVEIYSDYLIDKLCSLE